MKMEDIKRESNKAKRSRFDQVKQVTAAYLQRRNYPALSYNKIHSEDFMLTTLIENEISRPNSVLYSCFNNDPMVIDHTFSKFISWLKDLSKIKNKYEDLELLIGPLFCHVYLEILRGGHTERAANFFKVHLPTVDKNKCDNLVRELINAFASDGAELPSLKDNFRSNKYAVQLQADSVTMLKKFLTEAGHVVLLQVFQSWFIIEEKQINVEQEEAVDVENQVLCNGHVEIPKDTSLSMQKLLDAIEAVKKDTAPIYSVNLSHVKDEVMCGLLNRQYGLCAYSYNNKVVLRSLRTLQQLDNTLTYGEVVLLGHSARIYDIAMFNEHKLLISASQDKTIRLYDLTDYSEKTVYKGHEYPIYCLTTSNNGAYFASGSYDRSARLWSVSRKETLRVFAGHTQEITSIDFHSNCTYIASGSADKNIRMWSLKDAEPIRLLLGSKGAVYSVCFSPKGQYVAGAGEDRRLRIWDLASAKQIVELKTGPHIVHKIAISSDENLIATGSIDGTVKVWNFDSLVRNAGESNSNDPVLSVSVNPKLLSLEYCYGTFGCLTAQHNLSIQV